jgi:hypothetical protein
MGRGGSQRRETPHQNHGQGTGRKGTVGQRSELQTEGIRDRERNGERSERIRKGCERRKDRNDQHTSPDEGRGDGEGGRGGRGDGDRESPYREGEQQEEDRRGPGRATTKALNVLYLNAQSVVKKVDELRCVASMTNPDIILVTESRCNSEISNAFLAIDGYEIQQDLRTDREDTVGGRGGGLLVYGKTGLTILKLDKETKEQTISRPPQGMRR